MLPSAFQAACVPISLRFASQTGLECNVWMSRDSPDMSQKTYALQQIADACMKSGVFTRVRFLDTGHLNVLQ